MKKIPAIFDPRSLVIRLTEETADTLSEEYKQNQPIWNAVTKANKDYEPSIEQGNLLHACFKMVVENSPLKHHNTMDNVKLSCKIDIDFRDKKLCFVRPDMNVQFVYRSFAHDKLRGKERDQVIQKAFEWCSDVLRFEPIGEMTEVEVMVEEAKSKMKGNRI